MYTLSFDAYILSKNDGLNLVTFFVPRKGKRNIRKFGKIIQEICANNTLNNGVGFFGMHAHISHSYLMGLFL